VSTVQLIFDIHSDRVCVFFGEYDVCIISVVISVHVVKLLFR
jgi:hypothetical protein